MPPARLTFLPPRAPSIAVAAFCLFWFSDTVADPDLWGHVRFGQDILRGGALPNDVYSYRTEGARWINHEWLSEVLLAAVYDRVGPPGLIGLKLVLALGIVGLCHRTLRLRGLTPAAAAFLLALACLPFRLGMGTVRPQLFTYLGFAAVLAAIERTPPGREHRLAWLPLLFAAWVNLHGGVLAGVGVLGLWLGVRIVSQLGNADGDRATRARGTIPLIVLGVASLSALAVNPYGVELPVFLIRSTSVARPEISEWQPLALGSFPGVVFLVLVAIVAASLLGSRRPRRPEVLIILGVTAILAILSNRHYPLFALAAMLLVGEHGAEAWNRVCPPRPIPLWRSRATTIVCLSLAVCLIALTPARWRCIRIDPFYFDYPARAVGLLKAAAIRGNLAVIFAWGEYAIWHVGPELKVSIDGRRETLYPDDVYRQAMTFERGAAGWDEFLNASRTDLILLRNPSVTGAWLARDPGWIPLYQDTCCLLFARAGLPDLERILRTPVPALPANGDRLCFP